MAEVDGNSELVVVVLEAFVESSTVEEEATAVVVVVDSVVCAEVVEVVVVVVVLSSVDVVLSKAVDPTSDVVLDHGAQVSLFCSINGLACDNAKEARSATV